MPECAKADLQQSEISQFFCGRIPAFRGGGKGKLEKGEWKGKWKGLEKGKGKEKGQGREGKGERREALPQTKIYQYTTGVILCRTEQVESQTLADDWVSRIKMFVEQMRLQVT